MLINKETKESISIKDLDEHLEPLLRDIFEKEYRNSHNFSGEMEFGKNDKYVQPEINMAQNMFLKGLSLGLALNVVSDKEDM